MQTPSMLQKVSLSVAMSLLIAASTTIAHEETLTVESLEPLLAEEISQIMRADKRWTPLPPVIETVYASPHGAPAFTFELGTGSDRHLRQEELLQRAVKSATREYNGFCLIPQARVIDSSSNGEIALVFHMGNTLALVKGNSHRLIRLSERDMGIAASFMNGQWLFRGASGLYMEDGGQTHQILQPPQGTMKILAEEDRLVVVSVYMNRNEAGAQRRRHVQVAARFGPTWRYKVFEKLPQLPQRTLEPGLLRSPEGRLLLIMGKIVWLKDYEAQPSASELNKALEAAERNDLKTLQQHLETLTLYSGALGGFAKLLEEQVGPVDKKAKTPANPPDPRTTIAGLIRHGGQYYRGQWISGIRTLFQESTSEAYLSLLRTDVQTGEAVFGVYRLSNDGTLHELWVAQKEDRPFAPESTVFRDEQGRLTFFLSGVGLAVLKDGRLDWIDRSPMLREMNRCLGRDSEGRYYFMRRTGRSSQQQRHLWMYNPRGQAVERVAVTRPPINTSAVMDKKQRLWFSIPAVSRRSAELPDLAELSPSRTVEVDVQTETETKETRSQKQRANRPRFAIGRLDSDGSLYLWRFLKRLNVRTLKVGRNGTLAACMQNRACVIDENAIYTAESLHEFAQTSFDKLIAAAPEHSYLQFPIHDAEMNGEWFWAAVDGTLWISHQGRVEAYRDGHSIGVDKQIQLLAPQFQRRRQRFVALIGPLKHDEGVYFFAFASSTSRYGDSIWILQKPEGEIEIIQPQSATGTVSGRALAQVSFHSRPLLAPNNNLIIVSGSQVLHALGGPDDHTLWPEARELMFVDKDGEVIASRFYTHMDLGYRRVAQDTTIDMIETFLKPLRLLALENDGTILCVHPEGLAWLAKDVDDTYRVARILPTEPLGIVKRYIGQTSRHVYLVVDEGSAVVQVPIKPGQ